MGQQCEPCGEHGIVTEADTDTRWRLVLPDCRAETGEPYPICGSCLEELCHYPPLRASVYYDTDSDPANPGWVCGYGQGLTLAVWDADDGEEARLLAAAELGIPEELVDIEDERARQ